MDSYTAAASGTGSSAAKAFTPDAGLRFAVPVIVPNAQPLTSSSTLTVISTPEEPAFALLLGNLAQLMSDGSIALGRSATRAHSKTARRSAYQSQLPNAVDAWDQRLDVDLGLSFSGSGRFNTSVGYAESIGEDNLDPAFVGWFEFRF
jgi:hypothetical protein